MLVILSRDPHPVQGSTIERAFVLCRTAYNGDPHAVQTSAVQNSAELAHFRSSAGGTRRLSALMAALLYRGHCSMAVAALWRRHTMTAAELGSAALWRRTAL